MLEKLPYHLSGGCCWLVDWTAPINFGLPIDFHFFRPQQRNITPSQLKKVIKIY